MLMRKKQLGYFRWMTGLALLFLPLYLHAQNPLNQNQPYKEVRGAEPENKPRNTTFAEVIEGDTVPVAVLGSVYAFPKENFTTAAEERYYWKLVRDVKLVYPLSKIVYFTLRETMDYLETIPDPKEREKHLHRMEKDLIKEYEPVLRKMNFTQGKILLKLINRECNSTSYDLIKAYRGSFTAALWQGVARIFHNDLKSTYDPKDKDYAIERIVIKIEQGQL